MPHRSASASHLVRALLVTLLAAPACGGAHTWTEFALYDGSAGDDGGGQSGSDDGSDDGAGDDGGGGPGTPAACTSCKACVIGTASCSDAGACQCCDFGVCLPD